MMILASSAKAEQRDRRDSEHPGVADKGGRSALIATGCTGQNSTYSSAKSCRCVSLGSAHFSGADAQFC